MINEAEILRSSLENIAAFTDGGEVIPLGRERFLKESDLLMAIHKVQIELLTDILKITDPSRMDIHNSRTEIFKKWQNVLAESESDEYSFTCPLRPQ